MNTLRITYNNNDGGLYLLGSVNPVATVDIDEKPEGYAVFTAPDFYDLARDPDFVAAGPSDIVIQNIVGSVVSTQEAIIRIAGIQDMLVDGGYYVITASKSPRLGKLSFHIIKEICLQQSFILVEEHSVAVSKTDNNLMHEVIIGVFKKGK